LEIDANNVEALLGLAQQALVREYGAGRNKLP